MDDKNPPTGPSVYKSMVHKQPIKDESQKKTADADDKAEVKRGPVSKFIETNFLHFNAISLVEAAKAYEEHIENGGKMMITLGGAMSTGELGITLAEMIRQDKVQIISCTGANLEEDIMNLVAHSHYKREPDYRTLSAPEEKGLLKEGFNRVTDTCIPDGAAMKWMEEHLSKLWKASKEPKFPHEYMYELLLSGEMKKQYEIDPKNSWMLAAAEKNLPIVVPGWEDSSAGNMFAAGVIRKEFTPDIMKGGIDYFTWLADWYPKNAKKPGIGFFQVGGGIAGDFPICVVPFLNQEMKKKDTPVWAYFCQVSDSTTSYGSYSGAVPNEKITWGKLAVNTPKFIVESDATIVVPLIFAYVLKQ